MMDCNKSEKLLVEYLYQELSPEKTLEIEKHLEACDACSKTLENWRGIHRGFQRSNDIPQPAPFLKTKILAAAKEELARKPSFGEKLFFWLKPALVLPVMIFGLLVLLFLPAKKEQFAKAKSPAAFEAPASSPVEAKREAAPADERDRDQPAPPAQDLKALGYAGGSESTVAKDELKPMEEEGRTAYKLKKAAPYDEALSQQEPEALNQGQKFEAAPEKSGIVSQQSAEPSPAPAAAAPAPASRTLSGKLDDAAENFQRAQVYFQNNDLVRGKEEAGNAIRTDSNKMLARDFHEAGRNFQSQGEPQQAIVQYNLLLNNYPGYEGSLDVLLRLGESYEQIGEYDKAIRTYQQLARIESMKKVAGERIQSLSKKQEVQEQLRSLGYVEKN